MNAVRRIRMARSASTMDAHRSVVSVSPNRLSCLHRVRKTRAKPSKAAFATRLSNRRVSARSCTTIRPVRASAPISAVRPYRTTTVIQTVARAGNPRTSVTDYVSRISRTRRSARISVVPTRAENASRRRLRSRIYPVIPRTGSGAVIVSCPTTRRVRSTVRFFLSTRIRHPSASTSVAARWLTMTANSNPI